MKKITIEKEEEIADVVERVLGESDPDVTIVIPKGSALARSARNFHLLKREADGAGKSIAIESVDETILAFAKESGLEGSHPLWRGVRGTGGVSDIIPAAAAEAAVGEKEPAPKGRGKKKMPLVKLTVKDEDESAAPEEEAEAPEEEIKKETKEEEQTTEQAESRFFRKRNPAEFTEHYEEEESPRRRGGRKLIWGGVGAAAIILIALGVVTWGFGHVSVAITFQKSPWNYQGNFVADKAATQTVAGATSVTIPAQVFTTQKNVTQTFPASGNANVSLRAQGTLTIYNAYSSAAQDLVATTRFVTPDGKLFRLVAGVTVPGAQVTNGQIVPSSVDAQVAADQPGDAYNVGPVSKLTIPGFQGSPKYNAFYGQLKAGTSGGFVGAKAVPTAADIASAKSKVSAALQANLTSDLTTSYPNNFKILSGATNVSVTKLTVNTSTDASGNFSVFGEAVLQAVGFDETVLKAYLLLQAQAQEASSTFSGSPTLTYATTTANFAKGTVSFSLSAQGTLEPAFDPGSFKADIAGKSIGDARAAVAALPGLASGKISAWPAWLWSIPSNPAKIQVTSD